MVHTGFWNCDKTTNVLQSWGFQTVGYLHLNKSLWYQNPKLTAHLISKNRNQHKFLAFTSTGQPGACQHYSPHIVHACACVTKCWIYQEALTQKTKLSNRHLWNEKLKWQEMNLVSTLLLKRVQFKKHPTMHTQLNRRQ